MRSPTLAMGRLPRDIMMSPRVAPPMIGLGLLEAIPEEGNPRQCRSRRRRQATAFPGKPNWVVVAEERQGDARPLRLEGRRADHQTSRRAEAASGDIGLSTTMIRTLSGDCTAAQTACLDAPNGNRAKYQDAELGDELFKLVVLLLA